MHKTVEAGSNIIKAAQIIQMGGLVAFPTETVYGLGADALNPVAVARIFEAKQRPSFDPLIVHIASIEQVHLLFAEPENKMFRKLANTFWPGPLTIVNTKTDRVPDIVSSGLGTVAVRMPAHPTAHKLLMLACTPVAAPSANRFGQISPTKPEHVSKQEMDIDYILTGENVAVGIESTVVSIADGHCRLLRPGGITLEQLKNVVPEIVSINQQSEEKQHSPGQLKSHYSPKKPLYIIQSTETSFPPSSGIIVHKSLVGFDKSLPVFCTSQTGEMREVAANLFSALHVMEDDKNVKQIFIQPVPETGLGVAIMDRINKAAYQYSKKQDKSNSR